MDMRIVQSTNIHAVGYDPNTSAMRVQFSNGLVYEYANVTPDVAQRMTTGDIGLYFATIVKPQRHTMPYVKLGVQPLARSAPGPFTFLSSGDSDQDG
jgi:hypothetical protein